MFTLPLTVTVPKSTCTPALLFFAEFPVFPVILPPYILNPLELLTYTAVSVYLVIVPPYILKVPYVITIPEAALLESSVFSIFPVPF